jgi:hypothetical protein
MFQQRTASDDERGVKYLAMRAERRKRDMPMNLARRDVAVVVEALRLSPATTVAFQPDPEARMLCCFDNALKKKERDGGQVQWGWTFHGVVTISGLYAWVNHHAVWISPQGDAVDITPLPQTEKDHPAVDGERVVFSPDDSASPHPDPRVIAPLPQRRLPLGATPHPGLVAYLRAGDMRDLEQYQREVRQALSALRQHEP